MTLIRKLPRWLRDPIWQLRYRFDPSQQYHLVRTGLRPGYADADVRMMHAMFNLLVEFVEIEEGGVDVIDSHADDLEKNPSEWFGHQLPEDKSTWTVDDWAKHYDSLDAMKGHIDHRREKIVIYNWWKHEREPAWEAYHKLLHQRYEGWGAAILGKGPKPDMTDRPSFEETNTLHDQLEAKDEEMLLRLVKIRRSLWT